MSLNIGSGNAIFVPNFTFFSTSEVVSLQGATSVLVDIDPITFNMNPKSLKEASDAALIEGILNLKTVIPVDLFGVQANYEEIKKICYQHNMFILEDGDQSFGGMIQKRVVLAILRSLASIQQSLLVVMATVEQYFQMIKT